MKERKGNNVLLTIIAIATLLIAVVGATFAYFTAVLTGKETQTSVKVTSGSIGTVFEGGDVVTANNIYPREEPWGTKNFHLKNNTSGTAKVDYDLSLVISNNTFSSGSLTFTLTQGQQSSDNGAMVPEITDQTGIPQTGNVSLGSGYFQGPTDDEVIHYYSMNFYFPETGVSQNEDQGGLFQGYVHVEGKNTGVEG